MVGFVDKIYSMCQLMVAIVENKVYVAIRLVLVMVSLNGWICGITKYPLTIGWHINKLYLLK